VHPSLPLIPLAVWLQSPANAPAYKEIGVNLYVGLWQGPTEEQLQALKQAGMPVICEQNECGLRHRDDPIIAGWMHGDEPDNAQSLGEGKGYGPPVPPGDIQRDYERIRRADPTRPVFLNLGQGVAWDGWYGRGVRTNHPEDYPEYVRGCDIASFDIYPACHDHADVAGRLWRVPYGVGRLRGWVRDEKPVWACIETTGIGNLERRATPAQVRAEVWMALIAGARGILYFAHQFQPRFVEAGLLADPAMAAEVARINREVTGLAAVLSSPSVASGGRVGPESPETGVLWMVKKREGLRLLFAVEPFGRSQSAELPSPWGRLDFGPHEVKILLLP
jgi:hypothetical protein